MNRFLEGIVVLDFSQYIPGPYASLTLGDLGASVFKIEPPAGDPMRLLGPVDEDGESAFYKVLNAGKTILRVNLKDPANQADIGALIRQADVLIESFRPGVLERLGLGNRILRELNPRLIHCAISSFGQNGPDRDAPGHDLTYMAKSGALSVSGTPENPIMAIPPTSDYASGLQAVALILAALVRKPATGSYIDISITDAVLAWQACSLSGALRGSSHLRRGDGEDSGGLACYRIYQCADGKFVAFAGQERKFWAVFCETVGRPDWIDRHSDPVPQVRLMREVEQLFLSRPSAYWEQLLGPKECCFHRVLDPGEVLQDPQIAARKILFRPPGAETRVEVLLPAWIDGHPPQARKEIRFAQLSEAMEILDAKKGTFFGSPSG
jgi:crotonobetainyl-CoA:carnitine CoA-transferase CaiB-like acyl-CoA transferase